MLPFNNVRPPHAKFLFTYLLLLLIFFGDVRPSHAEILACSPCLGVRSSQAFCWSFASRLVRLAHKLILNVKSSNTRVVLHRGLVP